MSTISVRLPDGTVVENVPANITRSELAQRLQRAGMAVPAEWLEQAPAAPAPPPASVSAGRTLAGIPRQVGLTARYALEGAPALADLVWEPARQLAVNPLLRAVGGPELGSMTQAGQRAADLLGLPKPETADERVVGDAARLVAGAAGGAGVAQAAARGATGTTQGVLQALAANPGLQATSAAGSGLAGGSVREAGGSEAAQFGAALLGGVAAPLAAQGAGSALQAGQRAIARATNPTQLQLQIDAQLQSALQSRGVEWAALNEAARNALREDARKLVSAGQALDPAAVERLAQFRLIGATPMRGDISMNARDVTLQRNLAKAQANMGNEALAGLFGSADLTSVTQGNAQRVLSTLDNLSGSTDDAGTTARGIIGFLQGKDASMQAAESALYRQAREAAGRDIPLARGTFLQDVQKRLDDTNASSFLPGAIRDILNGLSSDPSKPFTVNSMDQLKRILSNETATAQRAGQGNTVMALRAVRDALDNASPEPIKRTFGGNQLVTAEQGAALRQADEAAGQAMGLFDQARATARQRRQWQESAAFIDDALNGGDPDRFVQKHIIGGRVDDLAKMASEIQSPQLRESIRRQMVDYIMQRGNADPALGTFSSASLEKGLKAIGERRLALFFSPDEIEKLKAAVGVARAMQAQPVGSAVNNSNTAATQMGVLLSLLQRGSGIPGLSLLTQPATATVTGIQARGLLSPAPALAAPAVTPRPPFNPLLPAAAYGSAGLLAAPPQ